MYCTAFGYNYCTNLSPPPPPPSLGRSHWQLGSLSHAINADASGYIPLLPFPSEAPDPSVRDVEDDSFWAKRPDSGKKKKKEFYSDSDEEGSGSDDGSEFYSSISGSELSGTEDSDSDSQEGIFQYCPAAS